MATQLVLVGVNALVLRSAAGNPGGSMSVVQAVRFGGGALSPVAITPIYHADPLAGFLVPAALLAVAVPLALPRAPIRGFDRSATGSGCRDLPSSAVTSAEIARLDRRIDGVDETARALSDMLLEIRRSAGRTPP